MPQKLKISLIILVVILIAGAAGFYYYKNQVGPKTGAGSVAEAVLNPISGRVVGEKMPETNPFKAEVNPYEAYKNPFKQ
jgi:hypothetical protein